MANQDYVAKAVIETKQSQQDLTALGQAAKTAGSAFAVLDKQLKGSNTSLKDAAAALKSVVESTRQGAIAAKALADAEIKQARQSAINAKNADAHALSEARRTKELQLGTAAAERRGHADENNARAAQRATEATERHSMALQRHTGTQERQAAASSRAAAASLEVTDHLSNSRYLLYDVASTYQMVAGAMLAIPAAATAVAIAYERDMAQVVRTNDQIWGSTSKIDDMKNGLKDLASEIPVAFGQLAEIASIGGQLGIASSEMLKFTETVAKFGAASNVTTEQAATAFGRLQNAFPKDAQSADFFNKIGSSIAYVGVKSVATETEIIAVVNQLSSLAAQSGFTSEQVVGLSGALASVRIRPELARGAFLSTMTKMTNAAEEGATAFETYSKYLGMAGAEGKQLFESNPGEFFNQFIQGIAGAIEGGTAFSTVMADLGVKEKRETQFLLGLANGHEVLSDAMANSSKAYEEGTFLDDSTARVFSTVSAELQKLANNFKNLADTLGGSSMNLLAEFLRTISGVVSGVNDLATQYKGVAVFINSFLGIGAVVGVLLAFKAAQAAALAAVVAFRQVVGSGIQASISFSGVLKELAATQLMARGATLAQAQAYVLANGAMSAYRSGVLSTNAATRQLQIGTAAAGTSVGGFSGALRGAGASMLGLVGGPIGALVLGVGAIAAGFVTAGLEAKAAGKLIAEGMSAGEEEGRRAIAEQLSKREVGIGTTGASALGDWGKNIGELGEKAGVSMKVMVDAVQKGKGSLEELDKTMDIIAQNKGYESFDAWDKASNSGFDQHLNNLKDIRASVEELGNSSVKATEDARRVADGVGEVGDAASSSTSAVDEWSEGMDEAGTAAEGAANNVKNFIDSLFGLINSEAAVQSALEKLGESLAASTSVSTGDSGGRDNLAALQETMRAAAIMQQQLYDAGEQSAAQAQSNYVAFVDGLYSELTANGVDVSAIQGLADQAKTVFAAAVADENANNAAALKVNIDKGALEEAVAWLNWVVSTYGTLDVDVLMKQQGGQQLVEDVADMQAYVFEVTEKPYAFQTDAKVADAANKIDSLGVYAAEVTDEVYVMQPEADVNPAIAALLWLQETAVNVVNSVIRAINKVSAVGKVVGLGGLPSLGQVVGTPVLGTAPSYQKVRRVAAPTYQRPSQVDEPTATTPNIPTPEPPNFGGLKDGYDKAADAANKAGGAGKQAGKDMKEGIEEAKEAVDDYADRLGQGLTEAFNKQYGMQAATDNYYKSLNQIRDKRKEDLKTIDDMLVRVKELNNAQKADLIDARKAQIEKNISIKYGETDRAADYANQEKTALDNAAAKQKDIEATVKSRNELIASHDSLTGYTNAAIANREALRNVEAKMLDMIRAYAATGKSQEQVTAYTQKLIKQFQAETTSMWVATSAAGKFKTGNDGLRNSANSLGSSLKNTGTAADQMKARFNAARSGVTNMQGDMSRYINVVRTVPRVAPTKLETSNGNNARNDLNSTRNAANSIPGYKNVGVGTSGVRNAVSDLGWARDTANSIPAVKNTYVQITYLPVNDSAGALKGYREVKDGKVQHGVQLAFNKGGKVPGFASGGQVPGNAPSNRKADNMLAKVDNKGVVGIRSKEWIIQQPAVEYYGNEFMDNLNNMRLPKFNQGGVPGGWSAAASNNQDGMIVGLDAETMAAFKQFLNNPTYLFADAAVLASTVNKGGEILASRGVRN